ncbi:MAG: HAD family phosphatase [Spirochaetes bacterium]|nr:HAD family phosphatase [Spirochaetota bacterium]
MKYRLFACDLDGTLLDDEKRISEANLERIRQAKNRGVSVVITTGRSYTKAKQYITETGGKDPAIVFTGAVVYQEDRIIRARTLSRDIVVDIIRLFNELDYPPIVYPTDNKKYYESFGRYQEEYLRFSSGFDGSLVQVDDLKGRIWEDVIRVSVIGNEYDMSLLHREIKHRFGSSVTAVDTFFKEAGISIFEVLDKESSKSGALEFLCDRLDIKREEVIACGDNNNDIDMLRWAGLGVCMKNGMEEAVRIADYVTSRDNNEDGVAEALEKFVLG